MEQWREERESRAKLRQMEIAEEEAREKRIAELQARAKRDAENDDRMLNPYAKKSPAMAAA